MSPSQLPWAKRCALARSLEEHLRARQPPPRVVELVVALAADEKPEVRQAVANLMHLLDDGAFARLAAALTEDSNAFVRKAAERSVDRRCRGLRDADRARQKVQHVQGEIDAIERFHGRMAAERARAMAERFADVVVGTTAHNLGGAITSLKLKADALVKELAANEPDTRRLRPLALAVGERIAFLERLVRDMSDYARPLSADRRRERLAPIVEEAHRLARDAVGADGTAARGVACEVAVPESITVDIVRHQITAAIMHVIKNAYESLAGPGTVTVFAAVGGDEATITVTDTGGGLDPKDLAELREFVPGRTSKKNRGGTGFGLPTARRYVAAHGGSLEIDSEPGRGTAVTIRLPLERQEPDPQ